MTFTDFSDPEVERWYRETNFGIPNVVAVKKDISSWNFLDVKYRDAKRLESTAYQKYASIPEEFNLKEKTVRGHVQRALGEGLISPDEYHRITQHPDYKNIKEKDKGGEGKKLDKL